MRHSIMALFVLVAGVTSRAQPTRDMPRLEQGLFGRSVVANYRFTLPTPTALSDWAIMRDQTGKLAAGGVLYPARWLVGAAKSSPSASELRISSIDASIRGHASYLRPAFSVKIVVQGTIYPGGIPIALTAISGFVGRWSGRYLETDQGKRAMADALRKCLTELKPAD